MGTSRRPNVTTPFGYPQGYPLGRVVLDLDIPKHLENHLLYRLVGTVLVVATPQILGELEDIVVRILALSQIYPTVKVEAMGLEVDQLLGAHILPVLMAKE